MKVELSRDAIPDETFQQVCGFTADDYAQVLADLLPVGWAWPRDPETVLMRTFAGLAVEYSRVHGRDCDLLAESYPGTAIETLTDWERLVGLPDECLGGDQAYTLQQRRAAVLFKLAARGGASKTYFIWLAKVLGYNIDIRDDFYPFRVGFNRTGSLLNGWEWAFVWRIIAYEYTFTFFRTGQSTTHERLRVWGNAILECVMRRYKPAHTILQFTYTPPKGDWDDEQSIWDDGKSWWDRNIMRAEG
jgi:uncharacterized protein YmfQ (DUF2313 family)